MASLENRLVAALAACVLSPAALSAAVEGIALLDDGMPLVEPIAVELSCDGQAVERTLADSSGRFRFEAGVKRADQCRLRASLRGYQSALAAVHQMPADPEIGALILRRAGQWQGDAVSVTFLAAPQLAKEAFRQALAVLRAGDPAALERATALLESAVEQYPGYAEAWYQLGRLGLARNDPAAAEPYFRKAIEADPWYVSPYQPLLLLALAAERWESVVELCDGLLRMNPYLSDAIYYRGIASLSLGDVEAAHAAAARILGGPEGAGFALVHHLTGRIHEQAGEQRAATAAYRQYLEAEPEGRAATEVRQRLERLEESAP